MRREDIVLSLLRFFPKTYSEELGIDLKSGKEGEIFKWFLASILFGARISEEIAKKTFKEFERNHFLLPEKILRAGWDRLVEVLDSGGYVRYDFSTSSKLLGIMENLLRDYGSLTELYRRSKNLEELKSKLSKFKGIGSVTINIFLRELRDVWKVDVLPSKFTILAATRLGLIKSTNPSEALLELKELWNKVKIRGKSFMHLEVGLFRLGKRYCAKEKCEVCPLSGLCEHHG